jgi:hypothetical protein
MQPNSYFIILTKMKHALLTGLIALITLNQAFAQVGINPGFSQPNPAAGLDVDFTDKGFLPPRLTTAQRDAIPNPPAGLRIYNSTTNCENYFNGTTWFEICGGCLPGPPAQPSEITGNATPCPNTSGVAYSVVSQPGVTYSWNLPAGWTQTSGGNTNNITVTTGSSGGFITVTPSNALCGAGDARTLAVVMGTAPNAPTEGTHTAGQLDVTWNWSTVPGATGYRYNTTNQVGTSVDLGNATTLQQTGLNCGGTVYLYVWAYNACGNSSPVMLSQNTLQCGFVCGNTISHGYVAGVSPSSDPAFTNRTYSTVQANAAWGGKCWTKMNLGATAEPTTSLDTDANRAGWYFQFNRIQAYYHSGAARTPNTTWSMAVESESSHWLSANDPCLALLGASWRIPTDSEWLAYYQASTADGGMQSDQANASTVAFNSQLKLHAAGKLNNNDGEVAWKGFAGRYYSSVQAQANLGKSMMFYNGSSGVGNEFKAQGNSIRCIKD